jgi:hypothetical protein
MGETAKLRIYPLLLRSHSRDEFVVSRSSDEVFLYRGSSMCLR